MAFEDRMKVSRQRVHLYIVKKIDILKLFLEFVGNYGML